LPIFIERTTAANPPKARQTEPALRGPKAGRIVRLLADVAPPYTVLDLARAAKVSPAYVSRLLERLDRDALVERGRRGVVVPVDWSSLLRRRAEVYSLLGTDKVERYVCANGPGWALEAARDLTLQLRGSGRQCPPVGSGRRRRQSRLLRIVAAKSLLPPGRAARELDEVMHGIV
jgi:DNA-binding transcriptional ArsR family regulator